MKRKKQILRMQVASALATASQLLGIEAVTPHRLRIGDCSIDCVAFLPHFGAPEGMVIGLLLPPNLTTDPTLEHCVREHSLYCSHLNPDLYSSYDERVFKEALADWGYFGPREKRPTWLNKNSADAT